MTRPSRPVGRLDDSRCSVRALTRGDSPVATAAPAQRWLLIEQPGPWGRDALAESRFDQAVAPLLARRSRAENVRLLLVRRPGERLADSGRRWAYADSRPGREGLWWSVRASDADLLTAPWDGSVGERADRPIYLVCTHGGHDACCALRGRPLARAHAGARPGGRLGVQPPRRRPVRRQRRRPAARLLLRPGARRRRGDRRGARARAGGAAVAARPGRGRPAGPGRPAPRPRGTRAARPRRPARSRRCSRRRRRGPTSSGGSSRWPAPTAPVVADGGEPPVSGGRPAHLPRDPCRRTAGPGTWRWPNRARGPGRPAAGSRAPSR